MQIHRPLISRHAGEEVDRKFSTEQKAKY